MKTNGDILKDQAVKLGIRTEATRKTLQDVRDTLDQCKRQKSDAKMASMFLRHGWITQEARDWLSQEYPQ